MNCTVCECGSGLGNTGTGCSPLMRQTLFPIAVQLFDNDGNRNAILITDTLNQAYFDALINQADPSKRWFPYPAMKNVEDLRSENKYEEFTDTTKHFIREGARNYKGWIAGREGSPVLKAKIEKGRCVPMGYYLVTIDGNLVAEISADGTKFYPIQIDENSLAAMFVKANDETIQKLEVSWTYHPTAKDENLRMIMCNELTDVNLHDLRGLLDVCGVIDNNTTTGFRITLNTDWGTALNPVKDSGVVITDFKSSDSGASGKIYNETDDADITITSVTEVSDGVYDVVFPAQTVADVLIIKISRNGRDYTCVQDEPIQVATT